MFKALPSREEFEHRVALWIVESSLRPRFEEEAEEWEPGDLTGQTEGR